jgi:hypothetical protein
MAFFMGQRYTHNTDSGAPEECRRAALRHSSGAAVWQIVPALGPRDRFVAGSPHRPGIIPNSRRGFKARIYKDGRLRLYDRI